MRRRFLQRAAARQGRAMGKRNSLPEMVLDCRRLQQQQPQRNLNEGPSLLKALAKDGYSPRDRMVGWSYVLVAVGTCLFAGGGLMLVLALTVETHQVSLTGYYDIPTTIIGAAILGTAGAFFLVAYIKRRRHGHV
ncbi:uncharacterized protein LOC144094693 [Amblyomma americanum]